MYDVADERDGSIWPFRADEIALTLPYSEQEIESALAYLAGERLAEVVSTYNSGSRGYKLTHQGFKEVERSLQKPEEPTEHFPALANINLSIHSSGNNLTFQVGAQNTNNITQNTGLNLSDVLSLVEQLKLRVAELPSQEQQEDASVSIEILENELK